MTAIWAERRKRQIYLALVGALALSMPNLNVGMSISTIVLLAYSFYYPGFRSFLKIRKNMLGILLIGLFALHIVWLINTSDWAYAAKDLRIKLPLLLLPILLGAFDFQRKELQFVFAALSLGVWIACFVAYYNFYFVLIDDGAFRSIVKGISPVRLALLMSVLVAGILAFWKDLNLPWRVYAAFCVLNVLFFFNLIQSATGIVSLLLITVGLIIWRLFRSRRFTFLATFAVGVVIATILTVSFTQSYYQQHFVSRQDISALPALTPHGNPYEHHPEAGIVENGDYTFNYISRLELMQAWSERSEVEITAADGWTVATLIRYLSSKGLTKDRDGVMALSDADIANVEAGIPSVVYLEREGLAQRYHVLLMGYHIYTQTGDASGYSFYQRIIYWQLAAKIIRENFWLGVGTGDVKEVYKDAYSRFQPLLGTEFQHRAHNQFLTFFISFGVIGFTFFVMLAVVAVRRSTFHFLPLAVMFIIFLSCLTEDTLESQAGVTFFAFFYSVFARSVNIVTTA